MHVLRRLKSFAAGRSATVNEPVSRSIKWDSDNCVFSPWFDNQISLINPISGIRWLWHFDFTSKFLWSLSNGLIHLCFSSTYMSRVAALSTNFVQMQELACICWTSLCDYGSFFFCYHFSSLSEIVVCINPQCRTTLYTKLWNHVSSITTDSSSFKHFSW